MSATSYTFRSEYSSSSFAFSIRKIQRQPLVIRYDIFQLIISFIGENSQQARLCAERFSTRATTKNPLVNRDFKLHDHMA